MPSCTNTCVKETAGETSNNISNYHMIILTRCVWLQPTLYHWK